MISLAIVRGLQTRERPEVCQQLTATQKVMDNEIDQFRVSEDFFPLRRAIKCLPSADISSLPLIPGLNFNHDQKSWGYPFRFDFLQIDRHDVERMSSPMLQKDYVQTN